MFTVLTLFAPWVSLPYMLWGGAKKALDFVEYFGDDWDILDENLYFPQNLLCLVICKLKKYCPGKKTKKRQLKNLDLDIDFESEKLP